MTEVQKSIIGQTINILENIYSYLNKNLTKRQYYDIEKCVGNLKKLKKTEDYVFERNTVLNIGQCAAMTINGQFTVQVKRDESGYDVDVLAEDGREDDVIDTLTVWNEDLED